MPMVEAFVWTGGVFERVPDHTNRSTPKYKIPCLEQQSPPARFDTASTHTLLACNRWCMFMMESNQRGDLSRERERQPPPFGQSRSRSPKHVSSLTSHLCVLAIVQPEKTGSKPAVDAAVMICGMRLPSAPVRLQRNTSAANSNLWSGRKGGSRLYQRGAAYIRTHLRSSQVPPDLGVARTPIVSCRCLLA